MLDTTASFVTRLTCYTILAANKPNFKVRAQCGKKYTGRKIVSVEISHLKRTDNNNKHRPNQQQQQKERRTKENNYVQLQKQFFNIQCVNFAILKSEIYLRIF